MSLESLQAAGIQNQSELKSANKSETLFSGMSEDLFLEVKRSEEMERVADLSGGDMAGVDDKDEEEEDPRKKKKDMEFFYDIIGILYRFGVIKKKLEKSKNVKLVSSV